MGTVFILYVPYFNKGVEEGAVIVFGKRILFYKVVYFWIGQACALRD